MPAGDKTNISKAVEWMQRHNAIANRSEGLEAGGERRPQVKREIAERLRKLADDMDNIAAMMDYYGGFAEWAQHGREIAGAGNIARQWADEIETLTRIRNSQGVFNHNNTLA